MPDKFNMQATPFDRLTESQQKRLRAALDVAYYRARDIILDNGSKGEYLYILIKGVVEERSPDQQEVYAHYANEDMFDLRALSEGYSRHQYVALEDTLTYLLPQTIFRELYAENGEFAAYFANNLAQRQALIEAAQQQQNLGEFILTKVDSSIYHPAVIVSDDCPLNEVTRQIKQHATDAALIKLPAAIQHQGQPPFAIITQTDLLHAVMLNNYPLTTPVGRLATYPVVHVDEGDFLFNALVLMTRQRVKRLMVCDGNDAVGILDMTQILSAFSTHSHVLSLSIARATSIEELVLASNRQRQLVAGLLTNGIRTRFIMELISAVNELIIEKAFTLVVPPAMHEHCCLLVLGSEGRGEQILKTDQDNALIVDDEKSWPQLHEVMNNLTHTLQQLGYPLCPGNVMVSNPQWVKSQMQWQTTLSRWIQGAQPQDVMQLAIFADAHCVAGNEQLLAPLKEHLFNSISDKDLILGEFARPALSFSLPLTLFGGVKNDKAGLDIKQGGIFPIVHGIRTLSLEHRITATNTFTRIEQLQQRKVLEQETSENLSEALKLFIRLRLTQQLSQQSSNNNINLKLLDRTQRDLLRHSLHVVKKFKQWLGYHYQIRQ